MSFFSYLKEIFMRPPLIAQFEQMLVEEEARKVQEPAAAPLEPEVVTEAPIAVEAPAVVEEVTTPEVVAEPVVEALAVVAPIVASAAPKRAKTAKGKFVADDKSTPDVNEAFVSGKAPAKKTTKRAAKRKKR